MKANLRKHNKDHPEYWADYFDCYSLSSFLAFNPDILKLIPNSFRVEWGDKLLAEVKDKFETIYLSESDTGRTEVLFDREKQKDQPFEDMVTTYFYWRQVALTGEWFLDLYTRLRFTTGRSDNPILADTIELLATFTPEKDEELKDE